MSAETSLLPFSLAPRTSHLAAPLWTARVFPAEASAADYRRWLWLFHPRDATAEQWDAWRKADRYSFAEMAALADQEAFHGRRVRLHVEAMQKSLCRWFRHDSGFSAADLAHALDNSPAPGTCVAAVLREARRRETCQSAEPVSEAFSFARTIHTLGSACSKPRKQPMSPASGSSRPGSPSMRRRTTGSIFTVWD